MATTILENDTAAKFGNSPQKTGEPLDHAKLFSGKALEFDGVGDYLTSPYYHTSEDEITVSFWFYKNDSDTGHNYVVGMGGRSNAAHTACYITSGVIYWRVGNALTSSTGIDLRDGVWHRIVLTYDESNAKIYVDGVLNNSASVTGDLIVNGSSHRIGYSTGGDNIFTGSLCDYQVWNKVWELSDVQYDYNNPETLITGNASVTSGFTTSNLKLWYPMNDTGSTNPQTVIFDAAGTNNTTKNHATTTFFGDMTDLIADDASNGANLYNTANTKYDFTTESTASGTDTYDVLGNSHWTGNGATAAITTGESDTGMEIKNTGASVGSIRSGAITTVSGRTYQLDITHTPTSESHIDVDLGVYAGTSAGGTQYINVSNQSDGTYSGTFVATGAELHLTLAVVSGLVNKVVRVRTLQLREVGIATGWTEAHQQQTIPQTALMNGSSKVIFNGDSADTDKLVISETLTTTNANFSISFWAFIHNPIPVDVATSNYLFESDNDNRIYIVDHNTILMKIGGEGSTQDLSTNFFEENKWNHYVFTCNGDTTTFYKNTTPDSTTDDLSSSPPANFSYDTIGHRPGVGNSFNGILDEICVWDSTLSQSQINELYNNGVPLDLEVNTLTGNPTLKTYYKNNVLHTDGKWKDLSGNGKNATLTGGSTIFFPEGITSGKDSQGFPNTIQHPSNGAAYFDGVNSYINAGSNNTIDNIWRSPATVEFWIKPMSATAADRVMDKKPSGTDGWYIALDDVSGATCDIKLVCDATTTDSTQITASKEIALYQWNYVAIVYDGSAVTNTATMYIGGGSSNAVPSSKTVTSTNPGAVPLATDAGNDLAIGGRSGTQTDNSFDGFIDEVRIYNIALSLPEVKKNFNHSKSKHKN